MQRKQKAIYVHEAVFDLLGQAKVHVTGLTGAKLTWSSFLYILASGALAMSTFAGLQLRCPDCGHTSELFYKATEEPKK